MHERVKVKRQEYETQILRLRAFELETDRLLQLKRHELEVASSVKPVPKPRLLTFPTPVATSSPTSENAAVVDPGTPTGMAAPAVFDVCKYINLVPSFRETEVDAYFSSFERIAFFLCCFRVNLWGKHKKCALLSQLNRV